MAFREFWSTFFEEVGSSSSEEVLVPCPFHPWNVGKDDENPSMSVNVENGKYICFSCSEGDQLLRAKGDAYAFAGAYFDVDFPNAKAFVDSVQADLVAPLPPVSESEISGWQSALWNAEKILTLLRERKGLDDSTIRVRRLGWDGRRITIPIHNYRGDVSNVRLYSFDAKVAGGKNKMISLKPFTFQIGSQVYTARYGANRLWPVENALNSHAVVLMAGEWDCMLACQMGINAVTATGGEGNWKNEWNPHFAGRDVYVCYDMDRTGRAYGNSVAHKLSGVAKSVRIIDLPLTGDKEDKDFSDWVIKHGATLEDFKNVLEAAREYAAPSILVDRPISSPSEEAQEVSLVASAYDPKWQGKRVVVEGQVIGKGLQPFSIPKTFEASCTSMTADNPLCQRCTINTNGGRLKKTLGPDSDLLHLIMTTDESMMNELRKIVGVPGQCPLWKFEPDEYQNVEQILVTPRVEAGHMNGNGANEEHTIQTMYYVYDQTRAHVQENQTYRLQGARTTDPWKQRVTHLIESAETVQDSVSTFRMNEEIAESLKTFQVKGGQSVADRLAAFSDEIGHFVTHIYGRGDLVIGLLLVYTSVQQFRFQGQRIDNGLVEALIIGDTRTGKSEAAFRLARYIGLGEIVTGEATTFAGLVGGLQQGSDNHWTVTWGKIPQRHGQLVVIDEASGLSLDDIGNMSGIRSSLVAELTKIRQARTYARTRKIWMSNPRSARPLRAFNHGVEAISELIGKPEDVARFDLAIACASGEIPDEIINQLTSEVEDVTMQTFDNTALKNLVLWAWSRNIDQVEISLEATKEILHAALEMGRTYSSSIPLVESANQRIKIARLSVATACATFSTDETGERVIVLPEHVRFVRAFLDGAYAKPSLDYLGYSSKEKDDEHVAERMEDKIEKWANTNPVIVELIARTQHFTSRDLEEQLNIDKEIVKMHIHVLSEARMIEHTKHGYRKTAPLIRLLKNMKIKEEVKA